MQSRLSTLTGLPYIFFTTRISRIREHILRGDRAGETGSFGEVREALDHDSVATTRVCVARRCPCGHAQPKGSGAVEPEHKREQLRTR
jgi:hypothetical protein